jgi:hypothetical protein
MTCTINTCGRTSSRHSEELCRQHRLAWLESGERREIDDTLAHTGFISPALADELFARFKQRCALAWLANKQKGAA